MVPIESVYVRRKGRKFDLPAKYVCYLQVSGYDIPCRVQTMEKDKIHE